MALSLAYFGELRDPLFCFGLLATRSIYQDASY